VAYERHLVGGDEGAVGRGRTAHRLEDVDGRRGREIEKMTGGEEDLGSPRIWSIIRRYLSMNPGRYMLHGRAGFVSYV
jgi:hypothetical protein